MDNQLASPNPDQPAALTHTPASVWPQAPRTIAIVGCRLLALYFLYLGVVAAVIQMPTAYAMIQDARTRTGPVPNFTYQYLLMQTISWGFSLILAAILWPAAPFLARRMMAAPPAAQAPRPVDGPMLLTAGCVTVGIFVVLHACDGVVRVLLYNMQIYAVPVPRPGSSYSPPLPGSVWPSVFEAILGLWLIFGSKSLTRAIIYLRGLGPTADQKN